MALVYLLTALIGAAAAVFALQNVDPVVIRFLGWRIEGAPLAMVIMLSVLGGVVLTSLVGLVQQWRLRARIRQLEHRLAQAPPDPPAAPARIEPPSARIEPPAR
jgi:uncharacterized integral membrane protein